MVGHSWITLAGCSCGFPTLTLPLLVPPHTPLHSPHILAPHLPFPSYSCAPSWMVETPGQGQLNPPYLTFSPSRTYMYIYLPIQLHWRHTTTPVPQRLLQLTAMVTLTRCLHTGCGEVLAYNVTLYITHTHITRAAPVPQPRLPPWDSGATYTGCTHTALLTCLVYLRPPHVFPVPLVSYIPPAPPCCHIPLPWLPLPLPQV